MRMCVLAALCVASMGATAAPCEPFVLGGSEGTLAQAFAGERPPRVLDHGTGREISSTLRDGRWTLKVPVCRIDATVLRASGLTAH